MIRYRWTKFRIVCDNFRVYQVDWWRWYWPFWTMHGGSNTHMSIEAAKKYIDRIRFVKYITNDMELYND